MTRSCRTGGICHCKCGSTGYSPRHGNRDTPKLYAYVDESGQDTEGQVWHLGGLRASEQVSGLGAKRESSNVAPSRCQGSLAGSATLDSGCRWSLCRLESRWANTYGLRQGVFRAIAFRCPPGPDLRLAGKGQTEPGRPVWQWVKQ